MIDYNHDNEASISDENTEKNQQNRGQCEWRC